MNEAARWFLGALDEPALLLTLGGTVRHANPPALRLLGGTADGIVGRGLAELAADPPQALAALLRRVSGSAQSVLGTVQLRQADGGTRRCRCRGARLGAEEPFLLLRFDDASHDRFKVLADKIVALNRESRRSKRIQLQLTTALEQRQTLLNELHHRVKNNLQTLLGMLTLAERRAKADEAREAIRDARARVEAMAVLQRLLYQRDEVASVDARTYLAELCAIIERTFRRPGITVRVDAAAVVLELDLASSIGLIVNELVTNAFKHAFPDRERGEITIRLRQEDGAGGAILLAVEDDGGGFGPGQADGTGMLLVRGLVQQCAGSCLIETTGGLRCSMVLRGRQMSRPPLP